MAIFNSYVSLPEGTLRAFFASVPGSVPSRSHPPRGQVAAELTSRCDPLQFAAPWMISGYGPNSCVKWRFLREKTEENMGFHGMIPYKIVF